MAGIETAAGGRDGAPTAFPHGQINQTDSGVAAPEEFKSQPSALLVA